jgi:hypothetical protein
VKENVPDFCGVPLINPSSLNVKSAGNVLPSVRAKV